MNPDRRRLELGLGRLRRQLTGTRMLRGLVRDLWLLAGLLGALALSDRIWPRLPGEAWPALLALPLFAGLVRYLRRPDLEQAAAAADRALGASGRLLSAWSLRDSIGHDPRVAALFAQVARTGTPLRAGRPPPGARQLLAPLLLAGLPLLMLANPNPPALHDRQLEGAARPAPRALTGDPATPGAAQPAMAATGRGAPRTIPGEGAGPGPGAARIEPPGLDRAPGGRHPERALRLPGSAGAVEAGRQAGKARRAAGQPDAPPTGSRIDPLWMEVMRDGPAVATEDAPTALVAIPPAAADRRGDGGAGRSLLPYRARPTPAEQLLARRYFNHLEPGPAQ